MQLKIPTPCHEDWAAMRPEEKGRFCASCCKTVVDFSLMSDREVLAYLAGPVSKLCGRFTEDQLQRDLMPPQQKKRKGWMVWRLLLAGLLVASKGRAQVKPLKTVNHRVDSVQFPKKPMLMGAQVRIEPKNDTASPAPHVVTLPPVEVIGYHSTYLSGVLGGVSIVSGKVITSDSTPSWTKRLVTDTLNLLGAGKKEFSLYPNPAPRGTVIKLSLNLNKQGRYMVGLYNEAGMLVQEKCIEPCE